MWKLVFTKRAAKDAGKLKQAGLKPKAERLLEIMKDDPCSTPPAFESLVGNLSGAYSRRINLKHRLVYEVLPGVFKEGDTEYEGRVKVLSMWTHYDKL